MKSGTVAIIGRPNVGKSTLLNALVKEKIAIVSDKPQTTRTRVLAVLNLPDSQVVLLDTPGLHHPRSLLNARMVRTTQETMREADILYVMVEASSVPKSSDRFVVEHVRELLQQATRPVFLLINKVDLVKKTRVLPLIEEYSKMIAWSEIVPISAKTHLNLDRLLELTERVMSYGEALYEPDVLTDQPMRTLAAEMIREKILQKTREEVPHSVAVEIDQFIEEGKLARIAASILVEKDSQKAIVVGKGGERLKAIGTAARLDMEHLFGVKVFLQLWVKVRKAWRENKQVLVELGY